MLKLYCKTIFLRACPKVNFQHLRELQLQSPNEIHFDELSSNVKNFLLVDIRKPEEIHTSGKLPGAYNLPLDELENALNLSAEEFSAKYGFSPDRDSENRIVIYCRSGRRVNLAQNILTNKGFSKHRLYLGSFLDWTSKGGTIETLHDGTRDVFRSEKVSFSIPQAQKN